MKRLVVVLAVLALGGVFFGCSEAGNDPADSGGGTSYSMSFTLDGTDYSYSKGPSGAGGDPIFVYDTGNTNTMIQAGPVAWSGAPDEALLLTIDGQITSTGTYTENTQTSIHYLSGGVNESFGGGIGSIEVIVTDYSASVVKGTFTATGNGGKDITNGSFTVMNAGSM